MNRAIDLRTLCASFALILCASAACKKKSDAPAPEASLASASASPPTVIAPLIPTAALAADAGGVVAAPVLGEVKRFPDKEKVAAGAVKITVDDSKVYDEPDNTKAAVASLSKDLFVVRLASLGGDWLLVDFPSGVGKLSPGWIEAKSVGAPVQAMVTQAAVGVQPSVKAAAPATPKTAAPVATVAPIPTVAPVATVAAPVVRKPGAILARPR